MPLIKPRTRGKQLVKHGTRLDRENNETCTRMPISWASPPKYVLNQLIDTVLARDKEFLQWRAEHQGRTPAVLLPSAPTSEIDSAEWGWIS